MEQSIRSSCCCRPLIMVFQIQSLKKLWPRFWDSSGKIKFQQFPATTVELLQRSTLSKQVNLEVKLVAFTVKYLHKSITNNTINWPSNSMKAFSCTLGGLNFRVKLDRMQHGTKNVLSLARSILISPCTIGFSFRQYITS